MPVKCVLTIIIGCLFSVSCSSVSETVSKEKVSSGDSLKDKYAGGYTYGSSGGAVRSQSDKQSEYAGKSFGGTNDFSGKNFTTKNYANKRWAGNSDFASKRYAGNTSGDSFKHAPDFVQKQANYGGLVADGQGKNFGTDTLSKKNARERSGKFMEKPSSWYGERDNIEQPIVIQKSDQSAMSINQTREMLGRNSE